MAILLGWDLGKEMNPSQSRKKTLEKVQRLEIALEYARQGEWELLPVGLGFEHDNKDGVIKDLPHDIRVFAISVRDSYKSILWEPGDNREFTCVGRIFGAILSTLYNGHKFRMCLQPTGTIASAASASRSNDDNWWESYREKEHLLLTKLGLKLAFNINPSEVGDHDLQSVPVDYWWCPKRKLQEGLATSWWMGCEGYVIPITDSGELHSCLLLGSVNMMPALMEYCLFAFRLSGEGEQILILSRYVSKQRLADAIASTPIRKAISQLESIARFTDWKFHKAGPHQELGPNRNRR
jgi:hypothetical protein